MIVRQASTHSHPRHLLFNVGLWITVLIISIGTLFTARRYGGEYLQQLETQAELDDALALFQRDSRLQAQQVVVDVLNESTINAPRVLNTFNTDLLGLPQTYDILQDRAAHSNALHPEERARILLLGNNNHDRAASLLDQAAKEADLTRSGQLLRAKIALDHGDVHTARGYFASYWTGHGSERSILVSAILGVQPDTQNEAAGYAAGKTYALLWHGLWSEAFEFAKFSDEPTQEALQALELELNGNSARAADIYRAVLKKLPGHRLSHQRLAFLESGKAITNQR